MALDPNATWAAGLKDGKIRVAAGDLFDINAIVSAEGEPEQDEIEVKGDDEVKATFVSNISEELTIVANGISFDVLQAITGNSFSSSASGMKIKLGTDSQENPPFVEVQAFSQAKNADGTKMYVKKTWFKVQLYSIKPTQAGEQEFNIEMKGRAYQTATDVTGAALSENCVSELAIQNA